MMLLKVSTGIGSGIISQGLLQRGARGAAGDLGHIPIPGHAEILCVCGNYGCLEAVAGGRAIATRLRDQGLETYTVQDVVDSVKSGNPIAARELRQAGRDIGVALTACVNLLNPSLISLGGSLAHAGEHLLAGVREVVYAKSTPIATEHLVISVASSGDLAGLFGAGIMAISAALPPVPGRSVNELDVVG